MNPKPPPQPTITLTESGSVYDGISVYDELIDLDKDTLETYDLPGAASGRSTPNLYQRLGDEAVKPANRDNDDKTSDYGEYADLDRKTNKNYDPPDAEPGHAAPNSYQQLDTAAVKPISSTMNPIYIDLIDDETTETHDV